MKSGDAVTVVLSSQLVLIECHFASTVDYFLAGAHRLLFNEEGVTWLRGYHMPDEECVSAARTCQALREQGTGVTGATGPQGPTGQPLYPPPFGYPLSPQPQIGEPWPGSHTVDPYRLIITTSNTKGLM